MTVGDRVSCAGAQGTIREHITQAHTSDLYRIDWDDDPNDHDLYSDTYLTVITTNNNIPVRFAA